MKWALALAILPAVLAGCLGGEPPVAAVPTGQIDGAVVDQLLRPFGNHTVTLVQLGRTDQTSPLGGFTFREVPVGFYTVTAGGDGVRRATQVVDVEAGKVTRVILQLLPIETQDPFFEAFPYNSPGERPEAGAECANCAFTVPLQDERPAEITLEALWAFGPKVGQDVIDQHDSLDITVTDDRGFELYNGAALGSPFLISVAGEDLHPDARELKVTVHYGSDFLPGAQDFTMRSVMTLFYGATKADMFAVEA